MKKTLLFIAFSFLALTAFTPKPADLSFQLIEVEVYPNPATDVLFVRFDKAPDDNLKFEIINFIGNKQELLLTKHSSESYQIDVSQLSNGYYYLIVQHTTTEKKVMKKFLKK